LRKGSFLPPLHPHLLFPNLFKYAFVFCASPKKRKADSKNLKKSFFNTKRYKITSHGRKTSRKSIFYRKNVKN